MDVKKMHYDNVQEMLEDIETLVLSVIGGEYSISIRVDSNDDPNRPYVLSMSEEDYEQLCQRRTKK
jgi:hypothetical protein